MSKKEQVFCMPANDYNHNKTLVIIANKKPNTQYYR